MSEGEWKTRKQRIDPKLDACGWRLPKGGATPIHRPYRTEKEETDNGPADYALWLENHIIGLVEAKKLTLGPQGVLPQAERYARGVRHSPYNFDGFRAPFLYSTASGNTWRRTCRSIRSTSIWSRFCRSPAAWVRHGAFGEKRLDELPRRLNEAVAA